MRQITLSLLAAGLLLNGCGVGANVRVLTRPSDYSRALGFMQYGKPMDLEKLVDMYPALRGKVISAPEYIEEYERLVKERMARGEPIFEFKISPGASIDITVVNEPELSRTNIFVPPDGYDYFPYIGRVQLANLTREELRKNLEEKYRKLLKKPQVLIHLRSGGRYLPGGDFELGRGIVPGQGRITILSGGRRVSGRDLSQLGLYGGETIFSVLGGEGLGPDAEWRAIRVIRRDEQDPMHKGRIIFVDAWEFIANGDVRQDIPLRPGDFIFIPTKLTLGEQIDKDFNLLLGYLGRILSLDTLIERLDEDILK